MSSIHSFGEPKNVIKFSSSQIEFDEGKLSEILLHPDVRDREVVLFAIVGSYRRGKSFLMDYCLRFLYANYRSINNSSNSLQNTSNWIGDADEPLKGFSWRSGSVRDTTGITFWSDVFLYDPPPNTGDPIAIILVDTQGLFDPETSTEENMKILSLATLFSSTLILNINSIIQEDQLQYLQFTTEYATFARSSSQLEHLKPFQKFLFLIRDWQNVDEYDFGFDGGNLYLNSILSIQHSQNDDIRNVREHIRDSFEELLCCLMPYPGKKVASSSDYDGRWGLMDEDFRDEMKSLIEKMFNAENLAVKKVDGVDIKAHELFDIIKDYVKVFGTPGSVPKPKSLYELTVGKFLTQIVNQCFELYEKNLIQPDQRSDIDLIHNSAKSKSLNTYANAKKMGSAADAEKYKIFLDEKIQKHEIEWKNSMTLHLDQLDQQRKKAIETAQLIEQLQKEEAEAERKHKEEELNRKIAEHEREIARQREELERRQKETEEVLRKQKEAEEVIKREKETQRQLEEERRRLEEQARIEHEREEERRRRIKIQIDELGIKFHIPKPRCSVM